MEARTSSVYVVLRNVVARSERKMMIVERARAKERPKAIRIARLLRENRDLLQIHPRIHPRAVFVEALAPKT